MTDTEARPSHERRYLNAAGLLVVLHVDTRGVVHVSEESLAAVLTMAGFEEVTP